MHRTLRSSSACSYSAGPLRQRRLHAQLDVAHHRAGDRTAVFGGGCGLLEALGGRAGDRAHYRQGAAGNLPADFQLRERDRVEDAVRSTDP